MGEKSENITVKARCNAAGQLLTHVLILKEVRTLVTTMKV
jgi:hypothetical protein